MTVEMGKPLTESRGEVTYGASFISWFAEEALRVYGETLPHMNKNERIMVTRQPVGLVRSNLFVFEIKRRQRFAHFNTSFLHLA